MRNALMVLIWSIVATRAVAQLPQPTDGKLQVIDIEPKEGSEVDSSTVLRATLEYHVPARKGWYFVMALFDSTDPNVTFDGHFPDDRYRQLKSPSGQVTFEYPMKYIFNDKRLTDPIRVRFFPECWSAMGAEPLGGDIARVRVSAKTKSKAKMIGM